MRSFVHPVKSVWDVLSTCKKLAWDLLSMGSFVLHSEWHVLRGMILLLSANNKSYPII